MAKLFILGSCVTRDAFTRTSPHTIVDYFARTSLISLVTPPPPIQPEQVSLDSRFQTRIVRRDLAKDFFTVLAAASFDFLLVDFIDERFDLLRSGPAYITRSVEARQSGLEEKHPGLFEVVSRHTEQTHQLWERSCRVFLQRLSSILPPERVILHQAYWSRIYRQGDELVDFPANKLPEIDTNNRALARYYRCFTGCLPGVKVIQNDPGFLVANPGHVWGLSPFHYEERYYREYLDQLAAATSSIDAA